MSTWVSKKGFTIVELLIVIVIIAILAAITIVAFNGAQLRARDSARKQDLAAVAKAVQLYNVDVGDKAQSGCGFFGGNGWLAEDYDGAGINVSINDCLMGKGVFTNQNYLGTPRVDPSGQMSCATTGLSCKAYVKSSCVAGTWLMAHLETVPQTSSDTNATCNPTWDTDYGMNYTLRVE